MNEVKRYDGKVGHSPDGGYVSYQDYAALKDSAMDYAYRWGKAQDDIKKAHMLHSMQKEEIANLKEQLTATTNSLTNAQEALKSAGIEADTVQAGVMELVSRMKRLGEENAALMKFCKNAAFDADYESELGMERGGFTDAINDIKTPATDAYLNAVRAEGADAAAAKIRKAIPAFKDIHCGAVKECADIAEMVAAQFTAGNAGKDGVL